jgi:hypothetical protein
VGTAREQAGTLMHELGHNLGLRHGGCDDTNLKPEYASVMNYEYQMEGVTRGGMRGVVDYARGPEPVLDDVVPSGFDALLASPTPASDATQACVAVGAVRAGLAVRRALSPDATTRGAERRDAGECADGAAIDDWKAIRLDLGGIGRPPARR